jgi:hypothetical protein
MNRGCHCVSIEHVDDDRFRTEREKEPAPGLIVGHADNLVPGANESWH